MTMSGRMARAARRGIHPPGPYAKEIDAASERDRRWFEQHPDQTSYIRPRMPHEFDLSPLANGDYAPDATLVEVVQVRPGLRLRRLLAPPA
jgi:hypothetical protein